MPGLQWSMVFAELDPVRGSEQKGRRPVLVVSNEAFNSSVPNVTVLPLSTRLAYILFFRFRFFGDSFTVSYLWFTNVRLNQEFTT